MQQWMNTTHYTRNTAHDYTTPPSPQRPSLCGAIN